MFLKFTKYAGYAAVLAGIVFAPQMAGAATAPSMTMISPNGSETLVVGNSVSIRWESLGIPATARVGISLRNVDIGYPDYLFTQNGYNTGSYSSIVPNVAPGRYKVTVRVISGGPYLSATSNMPFSIVAAPTPTLKVTSPLASASWKVGSAQKVAWYTTGIPATAQVAITLRNMDIGYPDYIFTPAGYSANAYNTGSYSGIVPSMPPGRYQVTVRVINGGPYLSGQSSTFALVY